MRVTTTKSKNAESFYITHSYVKSKGVTTSKVIRRLGTLQELSEQLGTDRDGVMAWAKEQARIETEKYKSEKESQTVMIPFHQNQMLDYGIQKRFDGGYLFLQHIYYKLGLDKACRKIKGRHLYEYDLNAVLSDLVYTRILSPDSKRSSYKAAQSFLEPPSYGLHDVYRALSVLAEESDFIQSEVYKNSHAFGKRSDHILYYDCTNYYFETEQEEDDKKYGKSKEHRPNPIVQMGLFTDGNGIPLAFSVFPGNANEQTSLKPLETKVVNDFGCGKFVFCSDAGLGSAANRKFNHKGQRAFIVTQSIKKLKKEYKENALNMTGFRRITDGKAMDITKLSESDKDTLFYKEIPYESGDLDQLLIITYSPRYAAYQKQIRSQQVVRAEKMIADGKYKKQRKNPNDPARFINKFAVTDEGECADIHYELDTEKIEEESRYDGLYAVCTDLLDDSVSDILAVSEGRWQIEACFRIMKTEFSARPVYVKRSDRIKAHFLICFLSLLVYRLLEKETGSKYTCGEILSKLKGMNFADIGEQGFMPLYERDKLTDALHDACGFRTDYQFISKSRMKNIQKKSKGRE